MADLLAGVQQAVRQMQQFTVPLDESITDFRSLQSARTCSSSTTTTLSCGPVSPLVSPATPSSLSSPAGSTNVSPSTIRRSPVSSTVAATSAPSSASSSPTCERLSRQPTADDSLTSIDWLSLNVPGIGLSPLGMGSTSSGNGRKTTVGAGSKSPKAPKKQRPSTASTTADSSKAKPEKKPRRSSTSRNDSVVAKKTKHQRLSPIDVELRERAAKAGFSIPENPSDEDYATNPFCRPRYTNVSLIIRVMHMHEYEPISLDTIYTTLKKTYAFYDQDIANTLKSRENGETVTVKVETDEPRAEDDGDSNQGDEETTSQSRKKKSSWTNTVRHALSMEKFFSAVQRPAGTKGRGGLWKVNVDDIPPQKLEACRLTKLTASMAEQKAKEATKAAEAERLGQVAIVKEEPKDDADQITVPATPPPSEHDENLPPLTGPMDEYPPLVMALDKDQAPSPGAAAEVPTATEKAPKPKARRPRKRKQSVQEPPEAKTETPSNDQEEAKPKRKRRPRQPKKSKETEKAAEISDVFDVLPPMEDDTGLLGVSGNTDFFTKCLVEEFGKDLFPPPSSSDTGGNLLSLSQSLASSKYGPFLGTSVSSFSTSGFSLYSFPPLAMSQAATQALPSPLTPSVQQPQHALPSFETLLPGGSAPALRESIKSEDSSEQPSSSYWLNSVTQPLATALPGHVIDNLESAAPEMLIAEARKLGAFEPNSSFAEDRMKAMLGSASRSGSDGTASPLTGHESKINPTLSSMSHLALPGGDNASLPSRDQTPSPLSTLSFAADATSSTPLPASPLNSGPRSPEVNRHLMQPPFLTLGPKEEDLLTPGSGPAMEPLPVSPPALPALIPAQLGYSPIVSMQARLPSFPNQQQQQQQEEEASESPIPAFPVFPLVSSPRKPIFSPDMLCSGQQMPSGFPAGMFA